MVSARRAERHAANAKMFKKFLNNAFQIKRVNFASRSSPLQKSGKRWPVNGNGHAAFLLGRTVLPGEHAPDLKQRHVVILPADVVPQRMNQAGQQTRPQHVHVAAQRIRQHYDIF
jgi:hypothetical protein